MKKLLHAYILTGGRSETLFSQATELAAGILCEESADGTPCRRCRNCRKVFAGIHPDLTVVSRQSDSKGGLRKEITVDQIRAVEADAVVLPNDAENKVYIFTEAETMNRSAQNALLKLLEEPPSFVAFILCSANPALLLPTVRSRCALRRTAAEDAALPEGARERAEAYLDAMGDDTARLRCCSAMEKLSAAEVRELIEALRLTAPERLSGQRLLNFEETMAALAAWTRVNVGPRHVLGVLAACDPADAEGA